MFRMKRDRVVSYHGYRQLEPHRIFDLGGHMVMHVDGVNCPREMAPHVHRLITELEGQLIRDAEANGIEARIDNHHGFTLAQDHMDGSESYTHVRFSDGSMLVYHLPRLPHLMDGLQTDAGDYA